MKPGFLLAALAAACLCGAAVAAQSASGPISAPAAATTAAAPAPADAAAAPSADPAPAPSAATPATTPAAVPAPAPAATPEQQAALAGARPASSNTGIVPMAAPSATGSVLQTVFSLIVVLALLVGLAWLLKRFGPKALGHGNTVRLVGSLSVGTRERILVVEVGEQWIVVGASPGRMNALATMPRQEADSTVVTPAAGGLPTGNFADWFKQTLEKRSGK